MKDKVLSSNVRKAVESLARALRNYTSEPMNCELSIYTRDTTVKTEDDPDGIPDSYSVLIRSSEVPRDEDSTFSEVKKIFYSDDEFGTEGIREVIPIYREDEENES